jgi:hypothetical protein
MVFHHTSRGNSYVYRRLYHGLFVRLDARLGHVPKHPQAQLHPSELVMLALLFALKGVGPCAFYHWLRSNYAAWFPGLPEGTHLFRLFDTHHEWAEVFLGEHKDPGATQQGVVPLLER